MVSWIFLEHVSKLDGVEYASNPSFEEAHLYAMEHTPFPFLVESTRNISDYSIATRKATFDGIILYEGQYSLKSADSTSLYPVNSPIFPDLTSCRVDEISPSKPFSYLKYKRINY